VTAAKKTPLNEFHKQKQAKLVPFAGWEMPLSYQNGILAEHKTVRAGAGLFDVSHMGRFRIEGPGSIDFVNRIITNNAAKLDTDQLLYSCVCNQQGGVLDDVTLYRRPDSFLMVANAANSDRIREWLEGEAGQGVAVRDETAEIGQIALQGPESPRILAKLAGEGIAEGLGYYRHAGWRFADREVLVSRNGYTGEDGFEIYAPSAVLRRLWDALIESGTTAGVQPIGLGARDTLRMEMAYCLYGHELDLDISPLEAGLGWTVKMSKGDFIGRDALQKQKESGVPRKLIGLTLTGRSLPRAGDALYTGERMVGKVTSGGISPSLGIPIALGLVEPSSAAVGEPIEVQGRRGRLEATIVDRPFYKHGTARVPKGRKRPQSPAKGSKTS
jgi:aminomethyltransferase